jgi:hypothetical protein
MPTATPSKTPSTRRRSPDAPMTGSGRRTSRGYDPYRDGGIGPIGRRTDDPRLMFGEGELSAWMDRNPLRVLERLRWTHPSMSLAVENRLSLMCPSGDFRMAATVESVEGASDDTTDAELTGDLGDLGRKLFGVLGWQSARRKATLSLMMTGMICLEIVPGPLGTGIAELAWVDPLTILYKRNASGLIAAYQHTSAGDVEMDMETFLAVERDGGIGNPYGFPVFIAGLNPCLKSFSVNRDLFDALHIVGHSRIFIGLDYAQFYKEAVEVHNLRTEDEINAYVQSQATNAATMSSGLKTDDIVFGDKSSVAQMLQGGQFGATPDVLKHFDRERNQGLSTPGMLMGSVDSSTETNATVLYTAFAESMKGDQGLVAAVLEWVAAKHFQWQGVDAEAKADYDPIRSTDAYVESQTKALDIANDRELVLSGSMSVEDFCQRHTETGLVAKAYDGQKGEAAAKAYFAAYMAAIGKSAAPGTPDATQTESERVREARKAARKPDEKKNDGNAKPNEGEA